MKNKKDNEIQPNRIVRESKKLRAKDLLKENDYLLQENERLYDHIEKLKALHIELEVEVENMKKYYVKELLRLKEYYENQINNIK